jgi:3-deoxy-D-manno-octulosonic-acid transferase
LLVDAGACEQVDNPAGLAAAVSLLLKDANLRHDMGERGRRVVEKNRGALQTVLEMIDSQLARNSTPL